MCAESNLHFRRAVIADIKAIRAMCDAEVRKDVFDSTLRLERFIKHDCDIILAFYGERLIGWAAKYKNNDSLIRFLIISEFRGRGFGKTMLQAINPQIVRSKTDQSTGDPSPFYEQNGFEKVGALSGRKRNVQFMWRRAL